ncbi:hypothetical protein JCM8097_003612 [Rhodosporidiobolus ruineniae]
MALLSRLFRSKSEEEKKAKLAQQERERKVGDRSKRLSRQQLSDWEGKYGANEPSPAFAAEMEKGRSSGSGSTFLSTQTPSGARSIDFLPRFGFDNGLSPSHSATGKELQLAHTPPTPPLPPTAAKRMSTMSTHPRPALATIQPGQVIQGSPEWDRYLQSRHLGVAQPLNREQRASRSVSMFSMASLQPPRAGSPRIELHLPSSGSPVVVGLAAPTPNGSSEENDDDDLDNLPLAIAAAGASLRTRSLPHLPRPSTMHELVPPSPVFGAEAHRSSSTGQLPRSHSRAASLATMVPAVLAPVSPTLPPSKSMLRSPSRSPSLGLGNGGGVYNTKRSTLIDLDSSDAPYDPYGQLARAKRNGTDWDERVVIGDRRKAERDKRDKEDRRRSLGPKIMDFEELEERHKKRMSMLQTTANDHVATETAKKQYQRQQSLEAEYQRRKAENAAATAAVRANKQQGHERRRSLSSGNLLAAPGGEAMGRAGSGDSRRKSMSGLSSLLRFGSSEKGASSPDLSRSPSIPTPREGDRRASLARPSAAPSSQSFSSSSRPRPAPSPRPGMPRRHSLGTLLEASTELSASPSIIQADLEELQHEEQRALNTGERVEKVREWRRSSSTLALAQPVRRSTAPVEPVAAARPAPPGRSRSSEFGLLQHTSAAVEAHRASRDSRGSSGDGSASGRETTKRKKKTDWLAY